MKKQLSEVERKELEQIGMKGAKHSLLHTMRELQTEKSLTYLARKAQILLQREQHELGNAEFRSIYTDPDEDEKSPDDQVPGG